jgi:hypothetical protein
MYAAPIIDGVSSGIERGGVMRGYAVERRDALPALGRAVR